MYFFSSVSGCYHRIRLTPRSEIRCPYNFVWQQASSHEMNREGIIDRAHISPVSCVSTVISQRGLLDCWSKLFSTRPFHLTSTISIRSVNFINRKSSLDSELSEFERINVIEDALDFRAIRD